MKDFSFREFRPTIFFLVKFVGFYLVGNIVYGLYVSAFTPRPDPLTHLVSEQSALVLTALGFDQLEVIDDIRKPNTLIVHDGRSVLSIYEGCNGLNTMVMFMAFVFAFGPVSRTLLWFVPAGLAIIHVANLARISLLFYVAEFIPQYMYFTHKYFFTAALYAVIFILWVVWVKRYALKK